MSEYGYIEVDLFPDSTKKNLIENFITLMKTLISNLNHFIKNLYVSLIEFPKALTILLIRRLL